MQSDDDEKGKFSFSQKQIEDLAKSGITTEVAEACGFCNLKSDVDVSNILGWESIGLTPALLIPYYPIGNRLNAPVSIRIKPDVPRKDKDGKIIKYEQGSNAPVHIYIPPILPPDCLENIGTPLFITEGEKKAVTLTCAGYPSISAPGVFCFHRPTTDSSETRQLRDDFNDIVLNGRIVFIVFDSDKEINPKVLKAELILANMLHSSGANVKLIHLPYESTKQGVDDLIVKLGANAFDNLKQKAWDYPISSHLEKINRNLSMKEKHELFKRSLMYLAIINDPLESSAIEDFLKSIFKVSKSKIRESVKEVSNANRKNEAHENVSITDQGGNRQELIIAVVETLSRNNFFRYGNGLIIVVNDSYEIATEHNLPGIFNSFSEYVVVNQKERPFNRLLTTELSKAIITSPIIRDKFREIILFTTHPTYSTDFELNDSGYSENSKSFYLGDSINPIIEDLQDLRINKTTSSCKSYLGQLLQDICFKSNCDRDNFVGVLVSRLFPTVFMGACPLLAILGNRPGIGKSMLAQIIACIFTGRTVPLLTYDPNDVQFERNLTAHVQHRDYIIIDNVRGNKIESQFLEGTITSEMYSARILGQTKIYERKNVILFMLTANGASVGQDLLSRMITVELQYDGDPETRKFRKHDLLEWVKDNRSLIIAELMGMVEKWINEGKPFVDINFRFKKFASIVGGILASNGLTNFLKNTERSSTSYDENLQEIASLFEGRLDELLTASDLVLIAETENLFTQQLYSKSSPKAKSTFLGKLIGQYAGRKLPIDTDDHSEIILQIIKNNSHLNQYQYKAERIKSSTDCGLVRPCENTLSAEILPNIEREEAQISGLADILRSKSGEIKEYKINNFSSVITDGGFEECPQCPQEANNNLQWS